MPARKMPRSRSRIFHVPKRVAYMVENSPRGIRMASRLGFRWIDLDANITRDGFVVIAHWPKIRKDRFVLPAWFIRKYGRNPRIADCDWGDLQLLHTVKFGFRGRRQVARYHTFPYMAKLVGNTRRLGIALEVKGDKRFEDPKTFIRIDQYRHANNLPASRFMVMTLQNIGNPWARLRAAKAVGSVRGWPTVLLARGPIPRERAGDFDYVRGRMRFR